MIEVHAVVKKLETHVCDLITSENIQGEAAEFSKDIRVDANTRLIFTHRHITNVMIAIFNAPVISEWRGRALERLTGGGNIERGFITGFPAFALVSNTWLFTVNFNNDLDGSHLSASVRVGGKDFHLSTFEPIAGFGDWFL